MRPPIQSRIKEITVRIEFKTIAPPPPQREVVISLSIEDAKKLQNELYILARVNNQCFTVNRLMNELTLA